MNKRIFLALLLVGTSAHADDLKDRLHACGTIADDTARLACFDGLTATKAPAASAAPAVATAQAAPIAPVPDVTAPPPAPESLGAETLRHKDRAAEAEEDVGFSASVTRCSESADNRHIFYFDNGQVWKQSKNDRIRFRDCSFNVTITKDFFGYKMQQEGEKRRIRIKRLK